MSAQSSLKIFKATSVSSLTGANAYKQHRQPVWKSRIKFTLALGIAMTLAAPVQAGGASSHPDIYRKLVNLCVKLEKKPSTVCATRVRKNMAHMKAPLSNGYWWVGSAGGLPSLAVRMVEQMNREGNTAVFGRSCASACAIVWQLAQRKCLLYGGKIALSQHRKNGSGEIVTYSSRDPEYWRRITRGKSQPSSEFVHYQATAPKCPQGLAIAGYQKGRMTGQRTSTVPSLFQSMY